MTDDEKTYRRVLEWGCDRMLRSESMQAAKEVWDSFPVLQNDWVFVEISKKKKNELLKTTSDGLYTARS